MDLIAYWHNHVAPYLRARYGQSERGASLVEYALLVALIAVVVMGTVRLLGSSASAKFSSVNNSLK